ncbi:XshC-Cox1 family protein [Brevibacterium sp. 5221]|uniref:XshC-Cox1 family protein n=1 Tax=Brevibacterium rongguiense TaxID=2695267 RepID=A0A6N9H4B3_9MICO|nr:XdhC/CoxI family protein [Brevibacterium rongguiense]MYM18522.1 XshC-Cox1 family protein [Brevibacterium rongguiense]WAL39596.1 XdhC family protein [Brevibacterium sp. BRM-1]
MPDIAAELLDWLSSGRRCAVAIVVETWSSAPRPPGAMMAVADDGTVLGSLSGGCVEGAVHELALACLDSGTSEIAHYGVSDDEALSVGLACGGRLDVLVVPVGDRVRTALRSFLACAGTAPAALALPVPFAAHGELADGDEAAGAPPDGPPVEPIEGAVFVSAQEQAGGVGPERLTRHVIEDARAMMRLGRTGIREYDATGRRLGAGTRIFVTTTAHPPRLVVFGAIDYAAALTEMGRFLGYRVTVCDARPIFATQARFPAADEVVVAWPHRYLAQEREGGRIDPSTVLAILTHDLKFDVPVLEEALRSRAGFIGALGSRRTHERRRAVLEERGTAPDQLARISAPIGLDIGAQTPEATAVSIFAEVLARQSGATGRPLSRLRGPIHR